MGVHVGEAQQRGEDFFGPPLNECARIMAAGHGGQILVSERVAELLGDAWELDDLGCHGLRDLDGQWRLYQVQVPGRAADYPPLRTLVTRRTTLPSRPTSLLGRDALISLDTPTNDVMASLRR